MQTAKNRRKYISGEPLKSQNEKRNETIEPIISKCNKRTGNIWQEIYPPYLLSTRV